MGKENIIVDAHIQMSIGSIAHVKVGRKVLAQDVHQLACLSLRRSYPNKCDIVVHNKLESSLWWV